MREYAVVYEKTSTGYSVYCPDLPGLASCGSTLEEAERGMQEALEFHLDAMLHDGEAIPAPSTRVGTIRTDLVETSRHALAKSA